MITDSADAMYGSVALSDMYSLYTSTGSTVYPSPRSIGVPKSARQVMNTMMHPARMEGSTTGSVTVHMRRSLFMPRFSAASSREESMLFIAPEV